MFYTNNKLIQIIVAYLRIIKHNKEWWIIWEPIKMKQKKQQRNAGLILKNSITSKNNKQVCTPDFHKNTLDWKRQNSIEIIIVFFFTILQLS